MKDFNRKIIEYLLYPLDLELTPSGYHLFKPLQDPLNKKKIIEFGESLTFCEIISRSNHKNSTQIGKLIEFNKI